MTSSPFLLLWVSAFVIALTCVTLVIWVPLPLAHPPVPLINLAFIMPHRTCPSLRHAFPVSLSVLSTKFHENNDQVCHKPFHLFLVCLHTDKEGPGFLVNCQHFFHFSSD